MGMGAKTKTVGGGRAKPVADNFNNFLLEGLQSGQFKGMMDGLFSGGDNPLTNISPIDLNDPQFGAAQNLFDRSNKSNIADLRSRFGAAGGAPRGSAAMTAEAGYRNEATSRNVLDMANIGNSIREQNRADRAITSQEKQFGQNQQMQILAQIFNSLNQSNQIGTARAETVQQPSDFSQVMGAVSGLAPYIAAPFTGGASLGIPGLGGGAKGGAAPAMNMGGYRTPKISYDNLAPLSFPGL
jgi:hypothetical protein